MQMHKLSQMKTMCTLHYDLLSTNQRLLSRQVCILFIIVTKSVHVNINTGTQILLTKEHPSYHQLDLFNIIIGMNELNKYLNINLLHLDVYVKCTFLLPMIVPTNQKRSERNVCQCVLQMHAVQNQIFYSLRTWLPFIYLKIDLSPSRILLYL